jgi:hypothetical protein
MRDVLDSKKARDAWKDFPYPLPGEKVFMGFISKGAPAFSIPGTWVWNKDHYVKISDEGTSYLFAKLVFRYDGRYYEWAPLMDRGTLRIHYFIRIPE